ncbi:MAG: phosphate acyltransferase PlsX [Rhodothermaceae bacterium]|nr:phosphate acyltransferase PlsX [Rhodothermaceae bacterium]MXW32262.1 phosphate acyltransferase PlsX [Rhodothermaceae bacterium]MXZ18028.1 phosphate acyltransferase PlsX [Rhodothermaceae bacterium]MYC03095.1 phosphate acyltransferase PlsX [Rhodothermaceae bacterium]MYE62136.1 phosphate acyltransferase PlsX [Rhodothermaceae bacterium]
MAIRVAVDAMGGDQAPTVIVEGAVRAAQSSKGRLQVQLCGPETVVQPVLESFGAVSGIEVVHAPEVIGMGDSPVAAVRTKPNSSIHVGLRRHKESRADAFLSAGNTGAIAAASLFVLGRLPGVFRPSITTFYPTTKGACTILDVGSNMDSRPEHLQQFAKMGSAYARIMMDIAHPRIALLSVGEEQAKGNELVRSTHELLLNDIDLNFIGNVEGRDILHQKADVIVCDGFIGNVILKFGESIMTAVPEMIQQEMDQLKAKPSDVALLKKALSRLARRFDPENYGGGGPLLGVEGEVFILHGSTTAGAVEECIKTAAQAAKANLTNAIQKALAP